MFENEYCSQYSVLFVLYGTNNQDSIFPPVQKAKRSTTHQFFQEHKSRILYRKKKAILIVLIF